MCGTFGVSAAHAYVESEIYSLNPVRNDSSHSNLKNTEYFNVLSVKRAFEVRFPHPPVGAEFHRPLMSKWPDPVAFSGSRGRHPCNTREYLGERSSDRQCHRRRGKWVHGSLPSLMSVLKMAKIRSFISGEIRPSGKGTYTVVVPTSNVVPGGIL